MGAVFFQALDLPGDRCHRIQRAIGIEKLTHAHPDRCAARSLDAQPDPTRKVLAQVKDVHSGCDFAHADRGEFCRDSDRRDG